jgi:hypothetical protein
MAEAQPRGHPSFRRVTVIRRKEIVGREVRIDGRISWRPERHVHVGKVAFAYLSVTG